MWDSSPVFATEPPKYPLFFKLMSFKCDRSLFYLWLALIKLLISLINAGWLELELGWVKIPWLGLNNSAKTKIPEVTKTIAGPDGKL